MMVSYLLYRHYFLAPSHCSTNNLNILIFQETILHWTMVVGGTVWGLRKLHCYSIHSLIPKTINFQPCLKYDPLTHDDSWPHSVLRAIDILYGCIITMENCVISFQDISQKGSQNNNFKKTTSQHSRVYIAKRVTPLGTWDSWDLNPFPPLSPFRWLPKWPFSFPFAPAPAPGFWWSIIAHITITDLDNFGNVCRWNQRSKRRRREHQRHLCGIPTCPPLHNLVWYPIGYIGCSYGACCRRQPQLLRRRVSNLGDFAHSIFPWQFHGTLWGGTYGWRDPRGGWSNHCLGGAHCIYIYIKLKKRSEKTRQII